MSTNVSDELKNRLLSSLRTPEARDALDTILDAGMVADGGISTAKLADSSVTAPKIASDAVTTVKILDSNVTAGKLASDSVTTVKILNANVTAAKLASGVVPAAPFTATTAGDWSPAPTTIQIALDQLAARVKLLGG